MGNGQKFVYIIDSFEEFSKIPIDHLENAIFTEFVEGQEFTIDVVCSQDSKVYSAVPRLRKEVKDGMVVFAEIINNDLVVYLKLKSIIEISTIKNIKSKENNNLQFYNEIKSLVDSYSSKDNDNMSIEKTFKKVDKLSELLGIEKDKIIKLLKNKDSEYFMNLIENYSSEKQLEILDIITELN